MLTHHGWAVSGTQRLTRMAWLRRPSTTRTSALPTALPSASRRPRGWNRIGVARTTTRDTGAIRAARPPARTSTATGAPRPTRARARGTQVEASPARRPAAVTTTVAPERQAVITPASSTTRGPATTRAATIEPLPAPQAGLGRARPPPTTTRTPGRAPRPTHPPAPAP